LFLGKIWHAAGCSFGLVLIQLIFWAASISFAHQAVGTSVFSPFQLSSDYAVAFRFRNLPVNSADSLNWVTFGLVFGGSLAGIFTQTWTVDWFVDMFQPARHEGADGEH